MRSEPAVSIAIGSYNRKRFLKKTVQSLRQEIDQYQLNAEVIVVDGGSDDGTLSWLKKQKDIITIIQHNRGIWRGKKVVRRSWGYFMNLAFKSAQGKYICMLSDDCIITPGSLKNGVDQFEEALLKGRNVGSIAFYWRNWPQDSDYFVGLTIGKKMFVNHGLYLRAAIEQVNFIDENSFSFYHADGDLCLRMWKAGYSCEDAKSSFVEHYADANFKIRETNLSKQKDDWDYYLNRWCEDLKTHDMYEGGWVYKSFKDPCNTAKKFLFLYYIDRFKKLLFKSFLKLGTRFLC